MHKHTTVVTITEHDDGIWVRYEKSITNPTKRTVKAETFISNREIESDIYALKQTLINDAISELKNEVECDISGLIEKGDNNING